MPDGMMEVFRRALEQQMEHHDPPELAKVIAGLRERGMPEPEVWRALAGVLLQALTTAEESQSPFDRATYVRALEAL